MGMRGERVPPSPRSYGDAGITELALDKYASQKPRLSRTSDSGLASEMDDMTDLPPSRAGSSSLGTTPEKPLRHGIAHSDPIFTPESAAKKGTRGVASVSSPSRTSTLEELELAMSMEYEVRGGCGYEGRGVVVM